MLVTNSIKPSPGTSTLAPVQEYIRHLVFVVLKEDTIADVLRKLLKLPWAECEAYVLKCMLKVGRLHGVRGREGGSLKAIKACTQRKVTCCQQDVVGGISGVGVHACVGQTTHMQCDEWIQHAYDMPRDLPCYARLFGGGPPTCPSSSPSPMAWRSTTSHWALQWWVTDPWLLLTFLLTSVLPACVAVTDTAHC
jgi:hypothetical protein